MSWWSRKRGLTTELNEKISVPKGMAIRCEGCSEILVENNIKDHHRVCPHCGYHSRLPTALRMDNLIDPDSFIEHDKDLRSEDPLEFMIDDQSYETQIETAIKRTGATNAYCSGSATISGIPVEIGVFVFEFMGGSMGSVVGEKITRQFERAIENNCPAIILSASGGARMQEGVLSLMQMAKTASAREKLFKANVPYISVLLHPTTGGVAASVAMLGDIIIAEPNALIGFAGPRVIKQTIGQNLPYGFQRSEFLLEHGMIDMVVPRHEMAATLGRLLAWF